MKGWGPEFVKRNSEIKMETVEKFLTRMYRSNPDFVFTVTRDFVRNCRTPVLILPDDVPAHPVRRGYGSGDARAEGRSQYVSLERAAGEDSAGGAADPIVSPGASTGVALARAF